MGNLRVIWEDSALKLLEARDRYTRNTIREEFRRDPERNAIALDEQEASFLTPVSESRFSVIWHRNNDGQAVVRAVVPLTNLDQLKKMPSAKMKAYVSKVIADESQGEIAL
jgi:hypothetical protein